MNKTIVYNGHATYISNIDSKHARLHDTFKNVNTVNFAGILMNNIANRRVNAIDIRKFTNMPKEFETLLYENDFESEKAKAGKIISLNGVAAFFLLPIVKTFNPLSKWIFKASEVISFTPDQDGTGIGEIFLRNVLHDFSMSYNIQNKFDSIHMWKEYEQVGDKTVFKGIFFQLCIFKEYQNNTKDEEKTLGSKIELKNFTQIPVGLIRNNPEQTADCAHVMDLLKQYQDTCNLISEEKEYSKTFIFASSNNGANQNSLSKAIKAGQRVIDPANYNGKLGDGVTFVPAVATGVQNLIGLANWYEDVIYKFTGVPRDTSATGSNKHTTEVQNFNQGSSEKMKEITTMLEIDYTRLFKDLVSKAIGYKGEFPNLVLDISEFEQAKIWDMKKKQAEYDFIMAQVKKFDADAAKVAEETKFVGQKATAKPVKETQKPQE